jgi:hypothetical protein
MVGILEINKSDEQKKKCYVTAITDFGNWLNVKLVSYLVV